MVKCDTQKVRHDHINPNGRSLRSKISFMWLENGGSKKNTTIVEESYWKLVGTNFLCLS